MIDKGLYFYSWKKKKLNYFPNYLKYKYKVHSKIYQNYEFLFSQTEIKNNSILIFFQTNQN